MPCRAECEEEYIIIKPTAMFHTSSTTAVPESNDMLDSKVNYRLAFSMHSSFNELVEFLSFVRPAKVYPIVKPQCDWSLKEMILFMSQFFRKSELDLAPVIVSPDDDSIKEVDESCKDLPMSVLIQRYKTALRSGKIPLL